jgi:hypothetical protein
LNVDRNRDVAVEGLRQLDLIPQELELLTRAKHRHPSARELPSPPSPATTSPAHQIVYGPAYVKRPRHRSWGPLRKPAGASLSPARPGTRGRARLLTKPLALAGPQRRRHGRRPAPVLRRRVVNPRAFNLSPMSKGNPARASLSGRQPSRSRPLHGELPGRRDGGRQR